LLALNHFTVPTVMLVVPPSVVSEVSITPAPGGRERQRDKLDRELPGQP
jgi:hypothetical protein